MNATTAPAPLIDVNLTALERQVLNNIVESEYQDSNEIEQIIGKPIWSFSATDERRQLAGALGSLVKKGLAGTQDDMHDEPVCWITREGAIALGVLESEQASYPDNQVSQLTYTKNGKQHTEQFTGLPEGVYCAAGFQDSADAGKLYLGRLTDTGTALIPLADQASKLDLFLRNPTCYGKEYRRGQWVD